MVLSNQREKLLGTVLKILSLLLKKKKRKYAHTGGQKEPMPTHLRGKENFDGVSPGSRRHIFDSKCIIGVVNNVKIHVFLLVT